MKSRKTRIFATLGLVAIGGFSLMAISFVEAQSKDIQLNPENAKQTIPTIHFRSTISNQDKYVELTNVKNLAGNDTRLVRIDTKVYNFVLRKGNSDASGMGSTVLGGNSNNVDGGSYSTIIAGSGNQVNNLSYGTIGGGEGNIIDGSYGTVAGGRSNTAKGYSTVVGGNNNKANGEYAVALGKNTTADGNNSVAMGSGAVVRGANSFLWSDKGATVNANDVFVVDGQRGMVVNTGTAHRFAQMTIAGSLLINEADTNKQVECRGGTKGKGVVKVINRTGDNSAQVCFCSCDGDKRHSLFGAGNCSSVCGATSKPECSTAADNLIKKCDETKSTPQFVYSGKCAVGDVVDGPGAYFVDSNGYVHWTCQTNDGAHKDCSSTVKFTQTGACSEPAAEPECNGSYVGDCYEFLAGSDRGFNGRVDSTLYANRAAALGHSCAYYCVNGCYKDGDQCKERQDCTPDMINNYELPYLAHGASTGVSKVVAGQTCTTTASCNDGRRTLGADNCTQNTCTDPQPGNNTIKSSAVPTSSKGWTYKAGSSLSQLGACEWACTDNTFQRDGTTMNCKKIPKCTDPQPEGAKTIKSTAIPTSDKGWTYKTGYSLSQLGACEWSCEDNYERIGNNMYCTEVANKPCSATTMSGYNVPAMQDGDTKSVTEKKEKGDCELSCSAIFSCSNGEVTKVSENCSCNDGCVLDGDTLNNADCEQPVINDPITINVSCLVEQEINSSLNRCDGPAWRLTTFTVDEIVPVQLSITENLRFHNIVDSSCNYLVNETRTNEWVVNAGSDDVIAKPGTHTWGWRDVTAFDNVQGYISYYEPITDYILKIPSKGITVQYGRDEEIVVDGQTYKIVKERCDILSNDYTQPQYDVECGTANGTMRDDVPATNGELCKAGDPTEVNGDGVGSDGWYWECKEDGKTPASCTARKTPKCGNASGAVLSEFPSDDQACDPGYVFVDDNGQTSGEFKWRCGNGTGQVYCSADAKANVKFVVNYNGGGTIYVKEVDIGERGQSDRTSEYGCVPEGGGEAQLGQGGIIGNSITINCSGKDFMVGKTYYPDLVYGTVQGTWASGHPYGGYSITPSVGENVYTFTVDGYNCVGNPPGDKTIYPSTVPTSSNKSWTYKTGYSLSQLGACEWSCEDNYERDGTTMNCKKIPKCTDPQPEGAKAIKSTAIPTSDKRWEYKTGYSLSQLGACEWSCEDNYERIGNNMYCTEVATKPCDPKVIDGYGVPAMEDGETKSVPRTRSSGGCTLSCSAAFACSNGEVTKVSENCSCDNDCTLIPSNGATFDNAQCKSICDLPDNELTREYCYNNESLCKTFNKVEENIVVDPNGYCASDKRGTASDCCGKTWRCVMHSGSEGLEMIECEYQGENFCTTPTGYKCRDGYEFDGCDCVAVEQQEEILINITCSTKYNTRQGYDYWSCPQHWWIGTTYTADIPLPFDVHIAQTKYLYGISSRNGCSTCYHRYSNHTANYVIKKGFTESRKMGEEWEGGGDLIGPENHFDEALGYDGQFVNGYSSFVDSIDHWPEITVPDYDMYYTSSTGQNYTIVLHDCENLNNGIVNSMENYCAEPTNPNPGGGGGGGGGGNSGGGSYTLEYYLNGSNVGIYAVDSNNRNVTLPESLNLVVLDGNGNTSPIEGFVGGSSYSHYILNGQYLRFDSWLDFGDPLLCADRYTPGSAGTNSACTINGNVYTMNKCQTAGANCINGNPL